MLAPTFTPRLEANDIVPALTRLTAITVVAALDCTVAVRSAPKAAPLQRSLVNFPRVSLNRSPTELMISLLKFSMPYRKRIRPGTMANSSSQEMAAIRIS